MSLSLALVDPFSNATKASNSSLAFSGEGVTHHYVRYKTTYLTSTTSLLNELYSSFHPLYNNATLSNTS